MSQGAQAVEYQVIDRTTSYTVTEEGANKNWNDFFEEIILFEGKIDPNNNETFLSITFKEVTTNEDVTSFISYTIIPWLSNDKGSYYLSIVSMRIDVEEGQYNHTFYWEGDEEYRYGTKLCLTVSSFDTAEYTVKMDVRFVLNGYEEKFTRWRQITSDQILVSQPSGRCSPC